MPGTTARVVYHGLGVAGDRRNDTPQTILQRLERLIGDSEIEMNIQRMRQVARRYETERRAEQVVAELLSDWPH